MEKPPRSLLVLPAPLLEEEGDSGRTALIADVRGPGRVHRSRPRARLATHDGPVDPPQVEVRKRSKKRFEREETNVRARASEVVDSPDAPRALDADSHPD